MSGPILEAGERDIHFLLPQAWSRVEKYSSRCMLISGERKCWGNRVRHRLEGAEETVCDVAG